MRFLQVSNPRARGHVYSTPELCNYNTIKFAMYLSVPSEHQEASHKRKTSREHRARKSKGRDKNKIKRQLKYL